MMHINKHFPILLGAGIALQASSCKEEKKEEPPWNVIYIMADDLGYGDLGCYGGRYVQTPNLDQMASEGMRFTQFYSGSTVCAPSRCALMTGLHMGHTYVRGNARLPLRPEDTSLTGVLKEEGYINGGYGKWGLGLQGSTGSPEKKGFDAYFGYLHQGRAHRYTTDYLMTIEDGRMVKKFIDTTAYVPELMMEEAIEFLRTHADTSFFLYLPFIIPHAELRVPEEDLQQYLDEEGNSIFNEIPFGGQGNYRPQEMPRATFAAMVSKMDRHVGMVLDLVRELGIDDHTLVFFTSDNGPHGEGGHHPDSLGSNGPLRGMKRDLYEGGIRVPLIAWAPGLVPEGTESDHICAMWDIFPTVAELTGARVTESIDGISFLDELRGRPDKQEKHNYLYWEHYISWKEKFHQAVRKDQWKLVQTKYRGEDPVIELFNLDEDLGETNNLAEEEPELVEGMIRIMEEAHTPPEYEGFINAKKFLKDEH